MMKNQDRAKAIADYFNVNGNELRIKGSDEKKDDFSVKAENQNEIASSVELPDLNVIQIPLIDISGDDLEKQLGDLLKKEKDKAAEKTSTATLHYFGLQCARIIQDNNLDEKKIVENAGLTPSMAVELSKMVRLYNKCRKEQTSTDLVAERKMNCLSIVRLPNSNSIHPLNQIVYGAPGTGKTYSMAEYALAIIDGREVDKGQKSDEERKVLMSKYNEYIKNGQIVFTTFHQSYGYEEFIQGIRPIIKSGQMSFEKFDGVFKHIADKALKDKSNNYVIIIDEINRANISKVFGELITLIEEDKRWGEINQTCVTLPSGDVFAVPNNLYIIGTMNSADKSISLIDAALRRRFEFIEQYPDGSLVNDEDLKTVLQKLNDKLAEDLASSDLLIGHSYFMNKNSNDLCKILNNSVIPLLYEYYYDDKKRVKDTLSIALQGLNYNIVDTNTRRLYVKERVE